MSSFSSKKKKKKDRENRENKRLQMQEKRKMVAVYFDLITTLSFEINNTIFIMSIII